MLPCNNTKKRHIWKKFEPWKNKKSPSDNFSNLAVTCQTGTAIKHLESARETKKESGSDKKTAEAYSNLLLDRKIFKNS